MRKSIKKLTLLPLLIMLVGCSESLRKYATFKERGSQTQTFVDNIQDFLGNEVMESDNIQCQIETNDAFKDMDMRIFLEELLFSVELKSVVKALHNVVEGDDITSIDIEKITTAEVDPSMYETQAFLSFLERTSEGDINNYNSELSPEFDSCENKVELF